MSHIITLSFTDNRCRSIMTETLINSPIVEYYEDINDATNRSHYLDPKSIKKLEIHGINISKSTIKSFNEFACEHFNLIITVYNIDINGNFPAFLDKHGWLHCSKFSHYKATETEDQINASFDEVFTL